MAQGTFAQADHWQNVPRDARHGKQALQVLSHVAVQHTTLPLTSSRNVIMPVMLVHQYKPHHKCTCCYWLLSVQYRILVQSPSICHIHLDKRQQKQLHVHVARSDAISYPDIECESIWVCCDWESPLEVIATSKEPVQSPTALRKVPGRRRLTTGEDNQTYSS